MVKKGASSGSAKTKAVASQDKAAVPKAEAMKNRTKVLMLSTRGITSRYRHLMEDLRRLLPHAKKESKLDGKDRLEVVNEIAELRSCSNVMLLEARKRQDLYMWLARTPFGPTIKFHVSNVHTMDELSFSGNNLMYSRPLLTFDPAFDQTPIMRLAREVLTQTFTAPAGDRRTKPFVDHIMSFTIVDGRIWFRHYQIVDAALDDKTVNKDVESTVVEIGPRFVLAPIKCFSGGFQGATLWENPAYISPNEIRRALKKREGGKTMNKIIQKSKREKHVAKNKIRHDPLTKIFR